LSYDNCNEENNEKFSIDLDNMKRQLLPGEKKKVEEQKQTQINANENNTNNELIIDEQELNSKIQNSDFVEYVVRAVKKTVKCEDALIRQILYTGLSSYIQDDPINLGIIAPTSEGKTYPVEECMKFFPREDVYKVGSMSTKVLVRQKGILIDKNGEPIDQQIKELRKRRNLLDDKKENKEEKYEILEEMAELFAEAKTSIDLRGKILVFLEPPQKEVWDILKPILSHDSFEIEFPFVNQTDRDGHQTKNVVVRGWPSCIFCSAKDESNWPIWPEIKSRFLISSPNMIPKKYKESTKLISTKYGLPNLIQQQKIISDSEIESAKNCILVIKQNITELQSKNNEIGNKKISLWIPYAELLENELPSNKGTDVRLQKRIFSLLRVVPIIKFNLRKILVLEGETCVIADQEDLKEVLSVTQNFNGIPKFKAEFFKDIFYPCFAQKTKRDSNNKAEDDKSRKEEEILAVTTRQLCDYYKEIKKKPISTDNLKHIYLNELINEGIIDYTESKINAKQYIYYPLVTDLLSMISITDPIDVDSQQTSIIYEKIITKITESWIFCEIMKLIRYRLDSTNFELINYLYDRQQFQLLNNNHNLEEVGDGQEQYQEGEKGNLTIGEFIEKYAAEKSKSTIDNNRSNILLDFAKRSPFLSILAKIDNKDVN
jgi:hypothetical protein